MQIKLEILIEIWFLDDNWFSIFFFFSSKELHKNY